MSEESQQVPRNWTLHRPQEYLLNLHGESPTPPPACDGNLVNRIMNAYSEAIQTDQGSNFWVTTFGARNKVFHDAITSGDAVSLTRLLREPHTNSLFHGFEMLIDNTAAPTEEFLRAYAASIYDVLLRLAEAVGAIPLEHPESYGYAPPRVRQVEEVIAAIEATLGIRLEFPNIYPREAGLLTPRGIASYRAVQAVYQGFRIAELAKETGGSILEIGGGLGRTAYYSLLFGVKDYTIVDIAMTGIAQAYFLGRACGENYVRLCGESSDAPIKLVPPANFFSDSRTYGLVANIDSLPEIHDDMASRYLDHIGRRATLFLSINHETLALRTVSAIAASHGAKRIARYPYWMRRGYVEEIFRWKPA
jgi:hypothetical protein